ncbi:6-phospho-3-hexuloisomerase [Halalkalibacter lacteus]|uniref:6-phospho-3-hexuloisomerase n=1 Tax=Halalkalibacter lacteus TaxID=3090663 RepID=UPI002FCC4213
MIKPTLRTVVAELSSVFENVEEEKCKQVVESIVGANGIFVAGVGRSGFMMKAFAMRLMHLGLDVHVIGSAATPDAKEGDLLILGTGSGETESLKSYSSKAKKIGLKIITVTSFIDSTLGKAADITLRIPSPTPKSNKESAITSIQPMGTLFEQSLLICLDSLVMEVMEALSKTAAEMFTKHANLE